MPSPGMLEKHYSPRAELTLYEGGTDVALQSLIAAARAALAEGKSVGLIAAEEDRGAALASLAQRALFARSGRSDVPEMLRRSCTPRFASSMRLAQT